jgi:hypothetical protein
MAILVIRTKGLPPEGLELKKGVNRLGRSSGNDFMIQHETLSRFHCEVEVMEQGLTVRDMDSSNGTFVNGDPVVRPTPLRNGDLLRLGEVTLEVKDAPEPVEAGDVPACVNHPDHPASMICTQCRRVFCGACVHLLKRTGGKLLRLCPACSGHCEPLQGMNTAKQSLLGGFIKKLFKPGQEKKPFHE